MSDNQYSDYESGDYSHSTRHEKDDDDYDSDCSNDDNHESHRSKKGKDCENTISRGVAFVIWLVVLIILIWVLRAIGIRWFSAVGASLLFATLILCCVYPCEWNDGVMVLGTKDSLFGFIVFITIVVIIIWILYKVFTDRDDWYRYFCERYQDDAEDKISGWWAMWNNKSA